MERDNSFQQQHQQDQESLIPSQQNQLQNTFHTGNLSAITQQNIPRQSQEDEKQLQNKNLTKNDTIKNFGNLIEAVQSQNVTQQHRGIRALKVLTMFNLASLQPKLNRRTITLFVSILQTSTDPLLKNQAFIILKITSQIKKCLDLIIESGGVEACLQLIKTSERPTLKMVQLVCKLASTSEKGNAEFYDKGGFPIFLSLYNKSQKNLKQSCLFTLKSVLSISLTSGRIPRFKVMQQSVPQLCKILLFFRKTTQGIKDILLELFSLYSNQYPSSRAIFAKQEIIYAFLFQLRKNCQGCKKTQLRFLQQMASFSPTQIEKMLKGDLLLSLEVLISDQQNRAQNHLYVRKLLVALSTGSQQHIKAVISQPSLIDLLKTLENRDMYLERYFYQFVLNATRSLSPSLVFEFYHQYLVMKGFTWALKQYAFFRSIDENIDYIVQVLTHVKEVFHFAQKHQQQPLNTLREDFKAYLHLNTLNTLKNSSSKWIRREMLKMMFF